MVRKGFIVEGEEEEEEDGKEEEEGKTKRKGEEGRRRNLSRSYGWAGLGRQNESGHRR